MLILSHGKVTMKKCYNMVEITPAGRNYPVLRYPTRMMELRVELYASSSGMTMRSQIILTYDGVESGAVGELLGNDKTLTNNNYYL